MTYRMVSQLYSSYRLVCVHEAGATQCLPHVFSFTAKVDLRQETDRGKNKADLVQAMKACVGVEV
jgi:hypothetical protein